MKKWEKNWKLRTIFLGHPVCIASMTVELLTKIICVWRQPLPPFNPNWYLLVTFRSIRQMWIVLPACWWILLRSIGLSPLPPQLQTNPVIQSSVQAPYWPTVSDSICIDWTRESSSCFVMRIMLDKSSVLNKPRSCTHLATKRYSKVGGFPAPCCESVSV